MSAVRIHRKKMEKNIPLVILFDGVCNLCNGTVQFILKRDKEQKFKFASIQGDFGQSTLSRFGLPKTTFNSFILLEGDRIYTHSAGALRIFLHLGGIWKMLYAFILIPRFIRDGVYDLIARNRYKWFGKRDLCYLPALNVQDRFII
jgi:predicted DCC family thiol-disulfide oxidoreductase YuxK